MNNDFKEVGIMKYWCQKVLPLVYDDSLSFYELLGKIVKKLNDLIENNDKLPTYIQQLIESYITSGAIGDVVREILTGFMLNVKNPPNNLKPAIGDGTQDDTEAIQGCIDYARAIGGGCVYVPNGVYLTQSLVLYDNVSLFGFDRYSARLVLKGGATKPMFTGNVTNTSLTGLTIDGNMDIQVNNINLIDINAEELILQNLVLTDGYILVNALVNKSMQISDVICDYSVVQHMNLSGGGLVLGSNIYLHDISKLKGTNLVTLNNNNSVLSNIVSNGEAPVGFIINGNNNSVSGTFDNAVIPFEDNGANNTIINNGKTEQLKITGNRTNNVGGNETNNINGKYEINAENIKLNPTQPLEYKEPVELDEYFKTIPFKHGNENYDVLVKGNEGVKGAIDKIVSDLSQEKEDRIQADLAIGENLETAKGELREEIILESEARITGDNTINKRIDEIQSDLYLNIEDFGAIGDGTTDNTSVITNTINSALLNSRGVVIPNGEYLVGDLTIPETINVKFFNGGMLKVKTGNTVTVNGYIESGLYQIFSGVGNVVFGLKNARVYPEYFGAGKGAGVGMGEDYDFPAIQKCCNASSVNRNEVYLSQDYYGKTTNTAVVIPHLVPVTSKSGVIIHGVSQDGAFILPAGNYNGCKYKFPTLTGFKDFGIKLKGANFTDIEVENIANSMTCSGIMLETSLGENYVCLNNRIKLNVCNNLDNVFVISGGGATCIMQGIELYCNFALVVNRGLLFLEPTTNIGGTAWDGNKCVFGSVDLIGIHGGRALTNVSPTPVPRFIFKVEQWLGGIENDSAWCDGKFSALDFYFAQANILDNYNQFRVVGDGCLINCIEGINAGNVYTPITEPNIALFNGGKPVTNDKLYLSYVLPDEVPAGEWVSLYCYSPFVDCVSSYISYKPLYTLGLTLMTLAKTTNPNEINIGFRNLTGETISAGGTLVFVLKVG